MSMIAMLELAYSRQSFSQFARWLNVSRLERDKAALVKYRFIDLLIIDRSVLQRHRYFSSASKFLFVFFQHSLAIWPAVAPFVANEQNGHIFVGILTSINEPFGQMIESVSSNTQWGIVTTWRYKQRFQGLRRQRWNNADHHGWSDVHVDLNGLCWSSLPGDVVD